MKAIMEFHFNGSLYTYFVQGKDKRECEDHMLEQLSEDPELLAWIVMHCADNEPIPVRVTPINNMQIFKVDE